ncbi:hypothetical protein SteCoe_15092 [Stentor coeruleus]|uniref:PH domain-containing protein n=1 Tax=Stentor coeruleus TaxID=5963 RepID=A0A1R2C4E6_9CILI|nr:hypothetical protein SteCoe_15092 [Stentor coeruleus]
MEIIVIDDEVCEGYKQEILQEKISWARYLLSQNTILSQLIIEQSQDIKGRLKSAEDFLEKSSIFIDEFHVYCKDLLKYWLGHVQKINKLDCEVVKIVYSDCGAENIEVSLADFRGKYEIISKEINQKIDNQLDTMIMMREITEKYAVGVRKFIDGDWDEDFWLVQMQYKFSIEEEFRFIHKSSQFLEIVNDELNSIENLKSSLILQISRFFSQSFSIPPVSQVTKNTPTSFFLPLKTFSPPQLQKSSQNWLNHKGRLYLRCGEHKQWQAHSAFHTQDNFLHLFSPSNTLTPILSIKLSSYIISYNIIEDEFYIKLSSSINQLEFRLDNINTYKSWKEALSFY